MKKPLVLITGATGGMGKEALKSMFFDVAADKYALRIFSQKTAQDEKVLEAYKEYSNIEIRWGDLTDKKCVKKALQGVDLVLHIAAFVSPMADYKPKKAMEINFGGTRNLIEAIKELGQEETTRFVFIGTIAETGDRMPPIHWGRVGDPIKPSMFDYYAVSKVAAERYLIESGLTYWVSLRQTGIMGPAMAKIRDSIQFHNCLDNVLEYVSDRDSGRAMRNLCRFNFDGSLDAGFWNHIYNIGGGESCRISTEEMYKIMYHEIGIDHLDYIVEPNYVATRNFHGQYYLDSDKLENYLHFRKDSMDYFYKAYLKKLGSAKNFGKFLCKLPGGEKLMGSIIKKSFQKLMYGPHGTKQWVKDHKEDYIEAYWGSEQKRAALSPKDSKNEHFKEWQTVIPIDHGYDETKPEAELNIEDMKGAAEFRGGKLLSREMTTGDWTTPLEFTCQFGHKFTGSPRLILEGGHWCDQCERQSWNYGQRAKKDKFFAQVWNPLHDSDEMREYPKVVSDLEV